MHWYPAVPLLAAMALSALGGICLAMGTDLRANRAAAAMLLLGAWWAGCEVLWNCATDPETALELHRLAAPGFCFIGPLGMLLVLEAAEMPLRPERRFLAATFAGCAIALALCVAGPWMLARMEPVPWGYALVPGPAFAAWTLLTAFVIGRAIVVWVRDYRASALSFSRTQGPVVAHLTIPVAALGVATDAVLPTLGIQVPRLASTALSLFGVVCVLGLSRYGYSRLHPRAFATRTLHTLPDGVALTTLHGRIRVANERLAEFVGCPAPDLVGRALGDFLDPQLIDPPREQRDVECELRPLQGPSIPVCVSTAPVGDEDGQSAGVVLAVQDLRQVAALRSRLVISGRLAAVGELAAGIAHEINNPLAFVRANLALLRREWERLASEAAKRDGSLLDELDEWPILLDESIEGVDRAATIVRDIREFSHAGGALPELADLNRILDQVLRVAQVQLDPALQVQTQWDDDAVVPCDPQRLKQVFLNLVLNAGQAIAGEGRIRLSTRSGPTHVEVCVEDDGCGMTPEVRERIFDPFFTTKPVGRGTGLGLSLAYEIVRSHGGEIWCESEPGRGSTFRVRLPKRPAESRTKRVAG